MIVTDATEATTSNRVSLGMKCGECLHLTGPAAFEKPCSQLGKTSFAEACPSFTPDMRKMAFVTKGHIMTIAGVLREIGQPQIRLLAFAFRNADYVRKAGLHMGDPVVFSLGQDYLECYVRGYVLSADKTGETIYLVSDFEGLNGGSCVLTLLRTSLMDMEEFKAHRDDLISKGRIAEPKPSAGSQKRTTLQCLRMSADERALYRKQLATKPDDYTPPSLDTVPQTWLDNRGIDKVVVEKLVSSKSKSKPAGKKKDGGYSLERHIDSPRKTSRSKSRT